MCQPVGAKDPQLRHAKEITVVHLVTSQAAEQGTEDRFTIALTWFEKYDMRIDFME